MTDVIKKSGVREASELNVSQDFYGSLDDKVKELIEEADSRAQSNGRRTVQASDV